MAKLLLLTTFIFSPQEFMYRDFDFESQPKSVDRRKKGTCVVVAGLFLDCGCIEGINQIVTGKLVELSVQKLVDCDRSFNGCNGGLMDYAFQYIASNGLRKAKDYPYTREQGNCFQPLSVAINASDRAFQFYKSLDHGVTAVGYGMEKGKDYILVKNSWGKSWEENGFVKLMSGTGKPEGTCGINKMASFPTKKVKN